MKKIKKFIKILTLSFAVIAVVGIVSGVGFYFAVTHSVKLDKEKLEATKNVTSLQIYDSNGILLNPAKDTYLPINKISNTTKNAFICAEDKRFYNHSGIDYIRVCGAMVSNLKSRSFSQGASTISQQLIKNTQLSSEKTINRKLKEFKLTKQLEKQFSKDEILEMYLNNIYFGNGCYGIETASMHYFGKSAENLTLPESALLAGTINAPSFYDIQNKQDKALSRRNLILDLMKEYGKISEQDCEKAKAEPIMLNITNLSNNYYIFDEIIEEACDILNVSETQLKNSNLTIQTYYDLELQSKINSVIKNNYNNIESSPKIASIVIDNETNGILSIIGNKSVLETKKQPGSVIKPILVYAPAIENKVISPATKILDEKINFSGYSPENADKKFHGFVSARDALKNSLNIPAVKLLNEVGINNAQNFANKIGIEFTKQDNNLAIALGGFTEGVNLKSLADSYCTFANEGNYSKSKFINKISKNNRLIYKDSITRKPAMSDSTAYLITNMLQSTAKSGTAKRLKNIEYDLASKTGTVGLSSSSKNSDSYNISYTSNHTILSYVGGTIMPESVNGATYPTMITKDTLSILYENEKPSKFIMPSSVEIKQISKDEYDKNIIKITLDESDSLSEYFAKNNIPKEYTQQQETNTIQVFNFENKKPIISFFTKTGYSYNIMRVQENEYKKLSSIDNISNNEIIKFEDKTAKTNNIYTYYIEICEKSSGKIVKSNQIKLRVF